MRLGWSKRVRLDILGTLPLLLLLIHALPLRVEQLSVFDVARLLKVLHFRLLLACEHPLVHLRAFATPIALLRPHILLLMRDGTHIGLRSTINNKIKNV